MSYIVRPHVLCLLLNYIGHSHCHYSLDIYQSVYAFLNFPFNFLAFSFAIDSIVLLIESLASGNNTFDNPINVLYVSCVRDTFRYLVISVIVCVYLSFIYNENIGYLEDLSMTKIILIMWLCSSVAGNQCKAVPTPLMIFNDHYECMVYAYDYSSSLTARFDRKWVNEMGFHTKFICKTEQII
mgnify:CR=1 FL=1